MTANVMISTTVKTVLMMEEIAVETMLSISIVQIVVV